MKKTCSILLAVCAVYFMPVLASATLYNIQLNGFSDPASTFTGPARIGTAGDTWNNPYWVGVTSGSTTLFSGAVLVDSAGVASSVTATLTAAYNSNTNDWNDGGTFNRYTGREDGLATMVLMDKVVKVDKKPDVNTLTLSLGGLPANTAVKVYVYGSGNKPGSGGLWSLAAANGGASATIMYDTSSPNAATGRDATLATSQGLSWQSLSGKTDGSGTLTITVTAPGSGGAKSQIFMNGVQVEVGPSAK